MSFPEEYAVPPRRARFDSTGSVRIGFLFAWLTMNRPDVLRGSRTIAEPLLSLALGTHSKQDLCLLCSPAHLEQLAIRLAQKIK